MTPLALTMGEPAGIGPDIILQLASQQPHLFSSQKIVIVGNKTVLFERAALLGLTGSFNALSIMDIPMTDQCVPGQLNKNHAVFVIEMLTYAAKQCLSKQFSGVVTAPIHKGILNDAGFSFKGHTDFFSQYTQCETVMMLMNQSLKIALFTDHVPLQAVPNLLTQEKLTRCLNIILNSFEINSRKILVCGLNPHAGENGYLGSEENEVIIPVLDQFRKKGHAMMGPIGADVAFTDYYRKKTDIILTMYHDQGLPVIKYAGFHDAINVTLGLPFIRTSVDHGTALDIAGTGKANCRSLLRAIEYGMRTHYPATNKI